MIKLGVLGSTNGTDLKAIIDSINIGLTKAEVSIIISNQKNAYILKRGKENNIPSLYISYKDKTKKAFDSELTQLFEEYEVNYILLIGFMRILSSDFCSHWKNKILNVHPSLLPKYSGGMDTNIHREVILNGEKETGCTLHYVTNEVDGGPILIQKKCKVNNNETVETLKNKVQKLEGEAFIEAINLLNQEFSA